MHFKIKRLFLHRYLLRCNSWISMLLVSPETVWESKHSKAIQNLLWKSFVCCLGCPDLGVFNMVALVVGGHEKWPWSGPHTSEWTFQVGLFSYMFLRRWLALISHPCSFSFSFKLEKNFVALFLVLPLSPWVFSVLRFPSLLIWILLCRTTVFCSEWVAVVLPIENIREDSRELMNICMQIYLGCLMTVGFFRHLWSTKVSIQSSESALELLYNFWNQWL